LIPETSREKLLEAMHQFDRELRHSAEWADWERHPHRYAIEHDGRRYPVKEIISLATGISKSEFSGGDEANRVMRRHSFDVASIKNAAADRLDKYVQAFTRLQRDSSHSWPPSTKQRAPQKPLLLLAVSDLIARGEITSNSIEANASLRRAYERYWAIVVPDRQVGDMSTPFAHLANEPGHFWRLAADGGAKRSEIDETLFDLLQDTDGREVLTDTLLDAHFDESTAERLRQAMTRPTRAFWWVNQGSTYSQEKAGGFLWAPKQSKSGSPFSHWLNVMQVSVGDVIFHYANNRIVALSRVTEPPREQPRPEELPDEAWQREGYFAKVSPYKELQPPIQRADIPLEWRTQQTSGPFTQDGNVKQGYLFPLSREFVQKLITRFPDQLSELADIGPTKRIAESASVIPRRDLSAVHKDFSAALAASHIQFGPRHDDVVRTFVASLATKRLVILTGLSGSGKTQIAIRFGEWLGEERMRVVPVRPDWTGPEALLGYEDALQPAVAGRRAWHVPVVLEFMLRAARDEEKPYLLVLDEMNLAHVERYFADVLSGMESDQGCLPNLQQESDGHWRETPGSLHIAFPRNLFVVGTVNVDETTYMFSPKVLDRANTIEFRVATVDLTLELRKPVPCTPGPPELVAGFLAIARDDDWHRSHPASSLTTLDERLRRLHALLVEGDFEFGHRTFYEAIRFATMLEAAGDADPDHALDLMVMQKLLPRLHGSRRRLEGTLSALAQFCFDLTFTPGSVAGGASKQFDPESREMKDARLPIAFTKLKRMMHSLRANQFASFAE
jgi:MoxR-like ATPase